jgi:hypothetical protein
MFSHFLDELLGKLSHFLDELLAKLSHFLDELVCVFQVCEQCDYGFWV